MRISDWSSDVCSSDLKTEAAAEALSQKLGDRYRHCACAASLLYLQKGLWLRLMTGAPVPPAIAWKLLGQRCQSYSFCCPASIFQSHMSRTWAWCAIMPPSRTMISPLKIGRAHV